jgi:hypothetical protein
MSLKVRGSGMLGLIISMTQQRAMNLEEIRDFLDASQDFRFEGRHREEMYEWVKKTLVGQQYQIQGKAEKGLLRSYLGKMTGLSRAQVTRLIGQYLDKGSIAEKRYSRRRFLSRWRSHRGSRAIRRRPASEIGLACLSGYELQSHGRSVCPRKQAPIRSGSMSPGTLGGRSEAPILRLNCGVREAPARGCRAAWSWRPW